MSDQIETLLTKIPQPNLVYLSLLLFLFYQGLKFFLFKKIDRSESSSIAEKIVSKKRIREYGRGILFLAVFSLWFSQLQTVFVSLLAFAAAIVIAFKEVIMCVTGGMVVRLNKQFSTGDRIEVDGVRGFVIDRAITATKVLELGPEKNSQQTSGNIVTIPNSVFLNKAAVNQSYFQNYSIRSFLFAPVSKEHFDRSEKRLLEIADKICNPYLQEAERSISRFCHKEGISIPAIQPRIKLILSDENEVKLLLKMPVDNKDVGDIEQTLYREYYDFVLKTQQSVSPS